MGDSGRGAKPVIFHKDGIFPMVQHVRQAANQQLAALVRELHPLFSSMLMFTKVVGNESVADFKNNLEDLRGYVLDLGRILNKYDVLARRGSAVPVLVQLADRFDTMGAHAMADVLDETAGLVRLAQAAPQQLFQQQQRLADRLLNIHTEMLNATRTFSNPATIPAAMKQLLDQVKELGFAANALKQSTTQAQTAATTPTTSAPTPPPAKAAAVRELVALADRLDAEGKHTLADLADRAADMVSKFADKDKAESSQPPIKPGRLSSLSTRYCPDHHGVQAVRVAERVYQCPIDGRMYDYESGYVNYSGQRVPGGSIANQTPASTPYALPQRLFDSRQNIMNTLN